MKRRHRPQQQQQQHGQINSLSGGILCIPHKTQNKLSAQYQQEGLAVASIARDVVEMTPPHDDNAR